MRLQDIIGNFGLVVKVDVSDLAASTAWYQQKLGFEPDPRFDVPGSWSQLNVPGIAGVAVGLNYGTPSGSGSETTTFVVDSIEAARAGLIAQGVDVGKVEPVGGGVQLAFFADPDKNKLGLRQNLPVHPPAASVGWAELAGAAD
jgi:catechol 2,3-dioxygenase-like lactoylglutathione lyase family enzyme